MAFSWSTANIIDNSNNDNDGNGGTEGNGNIAYQLQALSVSNKNKTFQTIYVERVTKIYNTHNPSKLQSVLGKMKRYENDIDELHKFYEKICSKYNIIPERNENIFVPDNDPTFSFRSVFDANTNANNSEAFKWSDSFGSNWGFKPGQSPWTFGIPLSNNDTNDAPIIRQAFCQALIAGFIREIEERKQVPVELIRLCLQFAQQIGTQDIVFNPIKEANDKSGRDCYYQNICVYDELQHVSADELRFEDIYGQVPVAKYDKEVPVVWCSPLGNDIGSVFDWNQSNIGGFEAPMFNCPWSGPSKIEEKEPFFDSINSLRTTYVSMKNELNDYKSKMENKESQLRDMKGENEILRKQNMFYKQEINILKKNSKWQSRWNNSDYGNNNDTFKWKCNWNNSDDNNENKHKNDSGSSPWSFSFDAKDNTNKENQVKGEHNWSKPKKREFGIRNREQNDNGSSQWSFDFTSANKDNKTNRFHF